MGTSPRPGPRDVRATTDEMLAQSMWLRRLARSLVADASSADDLVQDAWVAVLKSPPEGDRPLRPWLARVVTNLVRTRHRVDTTRRERESGHVPRDHAPSASESIESIDMQRVLLDAVEALPEPQRSTIVRHYFKGLTSIEIAREDGVADSTVRWRIAQAVDTLRNRLDARHGGDRGAWMGALIPLARRADVVGPMAPVAAAGGIVMGVWMKVMVAAAIVTMCTIGAWWATKTPERPTPELLSSATVKAPTELDALTAPETSSSGEQRTEQPVASAVPETAAVVSAASDDSCTIEAHVLDARHRPIVGAELARFSRQNGPAGSSDGEPRATSDASGLVRLVLDVGTAADPGLGSSLHDVAKVNVLISAPHRTTRATMVDLHRGKTISLGDVILLDAGSIDGRAVDVVGKPVADIQMHLILPELTLEERDTALTEGLSDKPQKGGANTKPDGTFAIADVATGFYRVWTYREGWLHAVSEPFEVRAGEPTHLGDIVLHDNPRAIRGRIVGLDGQPAADAEIQYLRMFPNGEKHWISDNAEHSGEFVVEWFDTPTVDICAQGSRLNVVRAIPPEQRKGPVDMIDCGQALAREVPAGARDLVIQLMPSPLITITAKDQQGKPIERASIGLWDADHSGSSAVCQDGERSVRFPGKPVYVVVTAPGFVKQELGPFEPATAPERLDIVLAETAKVSGTVTDGGQPTRQGHILLMRALPKGDVRTSHGFPLRIDPLDTVPGYFYRGGDTFELTVDNPGRWVLVAYGFGRATWMSDEMELGPTKGMEGIRVELGDGGSIEGHVASFVADGSVPMFVTVSHGTGIDDVSARIAADGSFHIDELTPGEWLMRMTTQSSSNRSEDGHIFAPDPANVPVTIVAGKTTRVQLDARDARTPVLEGRIGWAGVDMRGWTASIVQVGASEERWIAEPVDANAKFRIELGTLGKHRLRLSSPSTAERSETIEDEVEIAHGVNRWALDADLGGVRLSSTDAADLMLAWTASSGARWTAHVRNAGTGEVVIDHVPAGRVRIDSKDGRWAEVDVVANGMSAATLH